MTQDSGTTPRPSLVVLHEDDSIVAFDKPPGLFVHDTALDRDAVSLLTLARAAWPGRWLAPVHRLDRPTSGVVLFARSERAASRLCVELSAGGMEKTYLAGVRGWPAGARLVDHPLARLDDARGPKFEARTEIAPLERYLLPMATRRHPALRLALVRARPLSGRTHQIRRHLKHLFHPIVGDTAHGDGEVNALVRGLWGEAGTRLFLHSARLCFTHPDTGERMAVEAPEPRWTTLLRDFLHDRSQP